MSPIRLAACLAILLAAGTMTADDALPSRAQTPAAVAAHPGTIRLISPLAGWNRSTLEMPGPSGAVATIRDGEPEYGLFALYVSPRVAVSDMAFLTAPHDGEVTGNILTLNAYGALDHSLTWNAGASWTWHRIDMPGADVTVNVPLAKAGIMARVPSWPVTLNPYLAYGPEIVNTSRGDSRTEILLYGLSVNAFVRRLHVNLKYYQERNFDTDRSYDTVSARLLMPVGRHWGWLLRGEIMEQSVSKDVSVLTGPAILF